MTERIGRDIHKSLVQVDFEMDRAEARLRECNPAGLAFAKDFIKAIDLRRVYDIYRAHVQRVEPTDSRQMNAIGDHQLMVVAAQDMPTRSLEEAHSSIMAYRAAWNDVVISWPKSGLEGLWNEFTQYRNLPDKAIWERNTKEAIMSFLVHLMHELGHGYEFQRRNINAQGEFEDQQGFARGRQPVDSPDELRRDHESMKEGWAELRALLTVREFLAHTPFSYDGLRVTVEDFDAYMPRLLRRPYYPEGLRMVWESIDAIAEDVGTDRQTVERGFLRASLTESGANYLDSTLQEVFGVEKAEVMRTHSRNSDKEEEAKNALTLAYLKDHPELHEEFKNFLAQYA